MMPYFRNYNQPILAVTDLTYVGIKFFNRATLRDSTCHFLLLRWLNRATTAQTRAFGFQPNIVDRAKYTKYTMMLRLRPHDVSPVLSSLAVLAFLAGAPTTTTAFSILDVLALTGDGVTCPVGCPLCHCINATESNVDACTRTRSVEACTSNALDEYTPVCWAGGGRRRGGDVRCPVRRRMRRTAAGHAAGLPVSTLRHIGVLQRLSVRERKQRWRR